MKGSDQTATPKPGDGHDYIHERVNFLFRVFSVFFRYFRTKRMRKAFNRLRWSAETRILDVGGRAYFWELARDLGLPTPRVLVVNLEARPEGVPDYIDWIVADARSLPFDDRSFDIAFSNSVIEHLGSKTSQVEMAKEVVRVADSYFVQTPNKWFPIEPHYLTPLIHWFPSRIRWRLARNFTVWGWITRPSPDYCRSMVEEIRLLAPDEMQELFPDAEILVERFCWFPKSILAVGTGKRPTVAAG